MDILESLKKSRPTVNEARVINLLDVDPNYAKYTPEEKEIIKDLLHYPNISDPKDFARLYYKHEESQIGDIVGMGIDSDYFPVYKLAPYVLYYNGSNGLSGTIMLMCEKPLSMKVGPAESKVINEYLGIFKNDRNR